MNRRGKSGVEDTARAQGRSRFFAAWRSALGAGLRLAGAYGVTYGALVLVWTRYPYYVELLPAGVREWLPACWGMLVVWLFVYGVVMARWGKQVVGEDGMVVLVGALLGRRERWDAEARKAYAAFGVKAFFIPLMVSFAWGHGSALLPHLLNAFRAGDGWGYVMRNIHFVLMMGMLLLDTLVFLTAYVVESRRLGNEIRSVEGTALGWAAALVCYPPFAGGLSEVVPLGPGEVTLPPLLVEVCAWGAIVGFGVYVLASVNLGLRAGNLVHRGIVSRGAYGVVRHPAYAGKVVAWAFQLLPGVTALGVFALLVWAGVYYVRAITEERHLSKDAVYRAYCARVRWRFVPGVW